MSPRITISAHAIVRWIERAGRFDLTFVREAIAADTVNAIRAGASRVTTDTGLTYALDPRRRSVITVLDAAEPNGARYRKRTPRDFPRRQEADD